MYLLTLRKLLAALVLSCMAVLMLACSSSDDGSTSSSSSSEPTSYDQCIAACGDTDWNCKDRCTGLGGTQ